MKQALAQILMRFSLWAWRTDETLYQYPFGPPDHGIRYRLAWWAYHWSRNALDKERG